jgi:hypothetical protein
VAVNWIADTNSFKLEEPPSWFMQALYDFDHQLVLLPSRKKAEYLLARRRSLTAGMGDVAMLDNKAPDTYMCYTHGVIPIAPLRWKDNTAKVWSQTALDSLLAELRSRDAWALGGRTRRRPGRGVESRGAFRGATGAEREASAPRTFLPTRT